MNTQSLLTRIHQARNALKASEPWPTETCGRLLDDLIADLESQLRSEAAASKGNLSAVRTITGILNAEKKHGTRKTLQYAWIDSNGRQCICNGYEAYRLNEHLLLEPRPDDAGDPIDLDKIFPTLNASYSTTPLPHLAELKAFIATEKAKNKRATPLWDLGWAMPVVDANLLLHAVSILPDATEIHYMDSSDGFLKPLIVRSERGDAILLPVRVPDKADQWFAKLNGDWDGHTPTPQEALQRVQDIKREYEHRCYEDPRYAMPLNQFIRLVNLTRIAEQA